ncbi:MAG: hypothetical protein OXC12_06805 [Spirochaetaceae bacterium]|nr:hypothetical protein [Spirochaetaceae bacterium]
MSDSDNGIAAQLISLGQVLGVAAIFTTGMCVMWRIFWKAVENKQEHVSGILSRPAFIEGMVITGIVGTVAGLASLGRLQSETTGVLLGSVVGYILGRSVNKK